MSGMDAFGTQLKRGDGGAPETFTAIANHTTISGPSLSRETIDTTAHDSPEQWMEFIGGLKDGGEITLEINYVPTIHDVYADDLNDAEPRNWQLVIPSTPPTTWTVALIMTGFEPEFPYDDKASLTLTFKVSGKPTI